MITAHFLRDVTTKTGAQLASKEKYRPITMLDSRGLIVIGHSFIDSYSYFQISRGFKVI